MAKLVSGDVVSRELLAYETICKTLVMLQKSTLPQKASIDY